MVPLKCIVKHGVFLLYAMEKLKKVKNSYDGLPLWGLFRYWQALTEDNESDDTELDETEELEEDDEVEELEDEDDDEDDDDEEEEVDEGIGDGGRGFRVHFLIEYLAPVYTKMYYHLLC